MKAEGNDPLASVVPKPHAWCSLASTAELSHQVCHRRGEVTHLSPGHPPGESVPAAGMAARHTSPETLLDPADHTLQSFLLVVNSAKFYL